MRTTYVSFRYIRRCGTSGGTFLLESGRRAASGEGSFLFLTEYQDREIFADFEFVKKKYEKPVIPSASMKPAKSKPEDSNELYLVDCDQYRTTQTTGGVKEGGEYSYAVTHPEPQYLYENV